MHVGIHLPQNFAGQCATANTSGFQLFGQITNHNVTSLNDVCNQRASTIQSLASPCSIEYRPNQWRAINSAACQWRRQPYSPFDHDESGRLHPAMHGHQDLNLAGVRTIAMLRHGGFSSDHRSAAAEHQCSDRALARRRITVPQQNYAGKHSLPSTARAASPGNRCVRHTQSGQLCHANYAIRARNDQQTRIVSPIRPFSWRHHGLSRPRRPLPIRHLHRPVDNPPPCERIAPPVREGQRYVHAMR